MNYCECGCSQIVKNRFINGHNNRGKKLLPLTKEHKINLSLSLKGKKKPKRTEQHKINLSNSLKGRKVWNKGKKDCQIAFNKGKTNIEIFGGEKAKEISKKMGKSRKGRLVWNKGKTKKTDKRIKKYSRLISVSRKGKTYEEIMGIEKAKETKTKKRLSKIKQIKENYGICYPSYNKKACEFFKFFDEKHNTKGKYAVYGEGEYQIKELGYFPDYVNFDLRLIIEWDEEHHFDENGNLKEKDIQRQKEIQEHFPDFEFRRIRENAIR